MDRTSTRQFELTFGGALRRMAMLVQDPRVRNILVQPRSAVAWDGVLAERKIVLANLDQADTALGAAGSRLLGSILVTQFWQAVLRRPADVRPRTSSRSSTNSRSSWTPAGTWRRFLSARAATGWD